MPHLQCTCGNKISDTPVPNPAKAHLVPDGLFYTLLDSLDLSLAQFMSRCADGTIRSYLLDYCRQRGFNVPAEEPTEEIAGNLFDELILANSRDVFQCTVCHRVHLQQQAASDRFLPFSPDPTLAAEEARDVFS